MIHWPSLGKALLEVTRWVAAGVFIVGAIVVCVLLYDRDPFALFVAAMIAGFIALVRCRYKKHSRKVSGM